MFMISVFSVAQLILIISRHLMLFVNRLCSCKLLSASILVIKTQFSIIFLCEFCSDIPWNNYLLTLPAYHLDKTKHIFSSFVACPALKAIQNFCGFFRNGMVASCWTISRQQEYTKRWASVLRFFTLTWDCKEFWPIWVGIAFILQVRWQKIHYL